MPIPGINISLNEEENAVELEASITIKFGYEFKPVCENVQKKVKDAVENMTNLNVKSINVIVANIKEEAKKE